MSFFEGRLWKHGSAALYVALTFFSFYCACYRLPVAVKYAVNVLVIGWALMDFFIRPQFDRAVFCLRLFALFFFPYLLFWMWSVGIWISEFQTFSFILRGSLNVFYMLTNILYTSASVYLFDVDAMFYNVLGMTLANSLVATQVAASTGIGQFIREYFTLIFTFAGQTGGAMRLMELHDMVYGWGVCVIFYAIHREPHPGRRVFGLLVSILYFTMGFKRIAVPAAAAAILLYSFLNHFKPKHLRLLSTLAAVLVGSAAFFYLYLIQSGIFITMLHKLGISLMYRDVLYSYFSRFFKLSPAFLGRGIRFIYNYATNDPHYPLATPAVHNVYMELYIEIGFWCWWIWIFYELSFRVHRIEERYTAPSAYLLLAMNFYVFATYLTDNTSFYYPINVLYRLAVMIVCYESMQHSGIVFSERLSIDEIEDLRREIEQEEQGRD